MKKLTVSFASEGVQLENVKFRVAQGGQLLVEDEISGKIAPVAATKAADQGAGYEAAYGSHRIERDDVVTGTQPGWAGLFIRGLIAQACSCITQLI